MPATEQVGAIAQFFMDMKGTLGTEGWIAVLAAFSYGAIQVYRLGLIQGWLAKLSQVKALGFLKGIVWANIRPRRKALVVGAFAAVSALLASFAAAGQGWAVFADFGNWVDALKEAFPIVVGAMGLRKAQKIVLPPKGEPKAEE